MEWTVIFHPDFDPEYDGLAQDVQDELLARIKVLKQFGPRLGRPQVDTLNGSRHANMKEIRFDAADGVWRFAFAFDSQREAIVLCGGDKSGGSESTFYNKLIEKADPRFASHLAKIEKEKAEKEGKEAKKKTSGKKKRKG